VCRCLGGSSAGCLLRERLPGILPVGVLGLDEADRLTQAIAQPSRIDPQVIEYFRRMLAEHYTGDKMLGPRQLLGTVMAQLEVLDMLRKQARPPVAKPLLRTLAQYAEFVGWLQQDGGDLHAAVYWSDRATQWAQSAADYPMVAYLVIRKSNIACLADDATTAVDLAAAAQDGPGGIEPGMRALAAQQEARGWAMIGDVDRCQRQLDTAAELLRTHSGETDPAGPVYLQHYDLDTLDEQAAICYRNVGRPEDAIPILERKIVALPANLHRDRGHRMAKLANAVIATRQPEPTEPPNSGWPASTSPATPDQRVSARNCTPSTGHSWPGGLTSLVLAPSTTPLPGTEAREWWGVGASILVVYSADGGYHDQGG
jgi:hypothetical protein